MATEAPKAETATGTTSTTDSTTGETQGQEQQDQQKPTPETGGQEQQQSSTTPEKLPDDHPLVKTLATQKTELASVRAELSELRAKSAKVTQLEEELGKRPTPEVVAQLQKRSDRLEAFLSAVGGPLGKALDSKAFTTQLFESETDIATIVKDWNKANPTATSAALGAGAAAPAAGSPDMNQILRAALK